MPFDFPEVRWGMSRKVDGQMKLNGDIPRGEALSNRKKFFDWFGVSLENTVSAGLVHGTRIARVGAADRGGVIGETDGLTTNEKNVFLIITIADCIPFYLFDTKNCAIGLFHAGWPGTSEDMGTVAVRHLSHEYQSNPEDIAAYLGPHIQKHHFEVRDDVLKAFSGYPQFVEREGGKILLDLGGILKTQLVRSGVIEGNISESDECTHCSIELFSYRRDKPQIVQAMTAFVGML